MPSSFPKQLGTPDQDGPDHGRHREGTRSCTLRSIPRASPVASELRRKLVISKAPRLPSVDCPSQPNYTTLAANYSRPAWHQAPDLRCDAQPVPRTAWPSDLTSVRLQCTMLGLQRFDERCFQPEVNVQAEVKGDLREHSGFARQRRGVSVTGGAGSVSSA